METEPLVKLTGVSKSFGGELVLAGLDLSVFPKETLVVIGKSGSGKSITIRHIVGLERPEAGRVEVFGKDLARLRGGEEDQIRLRIGYLFQSGALLNWMNIEENVELPLLEHRHDLKRNERRERVIEKLRQVGMEDARHKYPAEISGGMKKRAALARAIIMEPEMILYDEPTAGLDPVIASTINDLIIETGERLGTTQVVVTHDMESAFKVGDRIAMLYGGRIIVAGTPEEIKRSDDPVLQQFIRGSTTGPITDRGRT